MGQTDDDKAKAGDLLALVRRAEGGDQAAMPAVRQALSDPEAVDLLGGDLARQAQLALVGKLCGRNLLFKEALTRKLEQLRAELLGEGASPLERLLAERVVACWLHLHHFEAAYAGKDDMSPGMGAYYQRCLSAAQNRYLAAIKALALVRRLAVPALQVNIARKQVNVAGPYAAADGDSRAGRADCGPAPR